MAIALEKEKILQELSNRRHRFAEFGVEEIGLFGSFFPYIGPHILKTVEYASLAS